MAIRIRQGLAVDYDATKLLQGEFAYVTDTGKLYLCLAPGNVKEIPNIDYLQTLLSASTEAYAALVQLVADLEADPSEVTNILSNISSLNTEVLESTGYGIITGLIVSAQSTPDMTVSVVTGPIHMPDGQRFTPTEDLALAITAADATNPRIDIVYVSSAGDISYLAGTAAASPAVPTTPTGGQPLAQIAVAANATSIVTGNITDKRLLKLNNNTLQTNKFDKANIVTTDTVNDNTKVAGAGVVCAHGLEIDAINNNLVVNDILSLIVPSAGITFSSASYAKKTGKRIDIYLNISGYTITANTSLQIATVDATIRPVSFFVGYGIATDGNGVNNVLVKGQILSTGVLSISMPTVQPYCNLWFTYFVA